MSALAGGARSVSPVCAAWPVCAVSAKAVRGSGRLFFIIIVVIVIGISLLILFSILYYFFLLLAFSSALSLLLLLLMLLLFPLLSCFLLFINVTVFIIITNI